MNIKSTPPADATQFSKQSMSPAPGQLEISFGSAGTRRLQPPKLSRRARARWWFDRMRHVVNQALDWKPAPAARPVQIRLTLTSR